MFERFTQGSRQSVLYAKDAAFQEGSATIGPSHLLLGLEREDKESVKRFIAEHPTIERLRRREPKRGRVAELKNMKLSEMGRLVLSRAALSSNTEGRNQIEISHLLLGLLSVAEATTK